MMLWMTFNLLLTLCFLIVHSHVCDGHFNASSEVVSRSQNGSLFPRAASDHPQAASFILLDDVTVAACQTVWLNKLHRATYGSPADVPFLLPPTFPSTNVTLKVTIISVTQFSPSFVTLGLSVTPVWADFRFNWDVKLDCPMTSVQLKSNKIWRPAFSLVDSINIHSFAVSSLPLVVSHSGEIAFSDSIFANARCYLSVRLFPFDTQHCRLFVKAQVGNGMKDISSVSWRFDATKDLQLPRMLANDANWHVTGIFGKVLPDDSGGHLSMYFRLERKNTFSFSLWLVTSVFLTLMVCYSLGLEPSSVEKIAVSLLAMLSHICHLMLLLQILPADISSYNDSTTPILFDFSLVQFVIGATAVGLNGIIINKWSAMTRNRLCQRQSDESRNIQMCCGHMSHSAAETPMKIACVPTSSAGGCCMEEFATISHCKSARNVIDPRHHRPLTCRVCPVGEAGRLVNAEPVTIVEKNSFPIASSAVVQPGSKTNSEEQLKSARKPRQSSTVWMKQCLLIGYFVTMLITYATFIIVMVTSVGQGKVLPSIVYYPTK